jgi:hypothetical protein
VCVWCVCESVCGVCVSVRVCVRVSVVCVRVCVRVSVVCVCVSECECGVCGVRSLLLSLFLPLTPSLPYLTSPHLSLSLPLPSLTFRFPFPFPLSLPLLSLSLSTSLVPFPFLPFSSPFPSYLSLPVRSIVSVGGASQGHQCRTAWTTFTPS